MVIMICVCCSSNLKAFQYAKYLTFIVSSIERSAAHEAARSDQVAMGSLERSKLENEQVCCSCIFLILFHRDS